MNAVIEKLKTDDYHVADLSQADFGRREIAIAETEMPGLVSIREEFASSQPLKGARIAGSLHMTIQGSDSCSCKCSHMYRSITRFS